MRKKLMVLAASTAVLAAAALAGCSSQGESSGGVRQRRRMCPAVRIRQILQVETERQVRGKTECLRVIRQWCRSLMETAPHGRGTLLWSI